MKRIALPFVSLLAALALPSCLQQATTIHLNKDGSGTLVEETTLGAKMTAMMEQMGGLGGENANAKDPVKELASAEKAKARAATLGEGVTVQKVEAVTINGNKGARATYHFDDINKLKFAMGSGLQDAMPTPPGAPGAPEADKPKQNPTTFKYAGGVLTINIPAPEKADAPAAEADKPEGVPDMSEQMEPMMKEMMGDMKVSFKVVVDSGIAETNATHVKGNTVTLAEMDMGKVLENPGAFKKLQSTDQKDPEKAMEALKDFKGITMETKREITIKVK